MKNWKKRLAFWVVIAGAYLLAGGLQLWCHEAAAGIAALLLGLVCAAGGGFSCGKAWKAAEPVEVESAPCPNCGYTHFRPCAGHLICLCCGSVVIE